MCRSRLALLLALALAATPSYAATQGNGEQNSSAQSASAPQPQGNPPNGPNAKAGTIDNQQAEPEGFSQWTATQTDKEACGQLPQGDSRKAVANTGGPGKTSVPSC